jgi:tight adherence protein B
MITEAYVPVAIAALAAFSVAGVVLALFYTRVAPVPIVDSRLAAMAVPVARPDRASTEDARRKRAVDAVLRETDEALKAKKGAKPSLTARLRQAGLSWSKQRYYAVCAISGVGTFTLGLVLGSLLPAIGFGLAGGLLLPHAFVGLKRAGRLKRFSDEFPNAVDVIVRGVRAGLPLGECLKIIASEAREPVCSEFKEIVDDQMLGVPLGEAVQRMPERMPLPEASFVAIVIAMQSTTGGSLSEALGNLSKVLRERKKMAAKIKAMSSEARASGGIIGALPIVVGILVYLTTPDYMALLFTEFVGNVVLAACAIWMSLGILVMRKMINFDF